MSTENITSNNECKNNLIVSGSVQCPHIFLHSEQEERRFWLKGDFHLSSLSQHDGGGKYLITRTKMEPTLSVKRFCDWSNCPLTCNTCTRVSTVLNTSLCFSFHLVLPLSLWTVCLCSPVLTLLSLAVIQWKSVFLSDTLKETKPRCHLQSPPATDEVSACLCESQTVRATAYKRQPSLRNIRHARCFK